MNLKPLVLGLLAIALLSGIANVFLSVKFVSNHRKLQAQVGAIQQGMAGQQFLMNLLNNLGPYVQKDPNIVPILQKYGIGLNPNGAAQAPR